MSPSVSLFERGRGSGVVGSPPPSPVSSEGGEWACLEGDGPSVSLFERGRGSGWLEVPLRLAFRAKEGDARHSWKETAPPSRFSSEGGDQGGWKSPSVPRFERGRGMGVVGRRRPLRLAF